MSLFKIGKYVTIDRDNPQGVGRCDYSGFIFNSTDLVRQMEWRGNALVWTGLMVGKRFADVPNPQGRTPILKPDPVPLQYPRPPMFQEITWNNNPLPLWQNITETWESLWSNENGQQDLDTPELNWISL
jgi:hypothetical protein